MDVRSLEYRENAARTLRDSPAVRDAVTGATLHFDRARCHGYAGIDVDAWRRWAESVKSHLLTHLDTYLEEAAGRLEANGAHVHWAATAADACDILRRLVSAHELRTAVKGKSMLSEELGVNELLEGMGVEVFETDLGEYILQLLAEAPSHILGPAIHRSLDDIRSLFHERFGTPLDATPELLAAEARRSLRRAFLRADLGITGGNFLVAETGTLALIENEGNIRLTTSLPRVHVALIGIEKLLPRWSDLAGFLQLAARAATGQAIGTYVSLLQSPRGVGANPPVAEPDGPEHVYVILVDNGRSRVLADNRTWEILRCIRCGACLNACPVYRQTGGHAYGWVYSGPLGAVLNPGLLGLEQTHPLPFASTLCGACFDACPVRIPIPKLLLEWRRRAVEAGLRPAADTRLMQAFARTATNPRMFRAAGTALGLTPAPIRNALPVLRDWAGPRAPLKPAARSFTQRWPAVARKSAGDVAAADTAAMPQAVPASRTDSEVVSAGPAGANEAAARSGPAPAAAAAPGRRAFAGGTLGGRRQGEPASANAVLDAVRAALAGRARLAHPGMLLAQDAIATADRDGAPNPSDRPAGAAGAAAGVFALAERFAERFRVQGGEVVGPAGPDDAFRWLSAFLGEADSAVFGAAVPAWMPEVPRASPDTAVVGVSVAVAAAAETGTLVLSSRDGRAVQLLPPVHIVLIEAGRIRATLGEALGGLRDALPSALGLHSGPSRSADIGRVTVTGVHGPGRVVALILR